MQPAMSSSKRDARSSLRLALSQPIEWMGVALSVPEDWQIVRHGMSLERGSLTLVDRRVQRLQLSWTSVPEEPDVERMIDHERGELEKTESGAEIRALRGFGKWRVLETAAPSGAVTTRALRFDVKTSRLLEAVVSTRRDEPGRAELVRRLLDTLRVVCKAEAARHWCAFDIDLHAPPDFRLTETTVNPSDVTLRFEAVDPEDGRELGASVSVRRRGMVADWYTGNAEGLIRRDLPKTDFESFETGERAGRCAAGGDRAVTGQPATRAAGLEHAPPLRRLLGKRRRVQVLSWTCEPENALYVVTTHSPPARPVSPVDFDVHCCAEKRHDRA